MLDSTPRDGCRMRQLMFHGPGLLRWESVPEPTLSSPQAALVRPIAVAACDLDAALMESRVPLSGPFPLGHEFVAEVIEVGSDVTSVVPGSRVSVPFQISCGRCPTCHSGLTANCESVPALSSYGLGAFGGTRWGGALADLVDVPFADAMAVPVPQDLPVEHLASLSDNMPDAYRAVHQATPGEDVLIVGSGSIGLYAVGLAVGRGADVTYVDSSAERCGIAERYGATVEQGALARPRRGHQRVVHTSADPTQLSNALLSTAHGGTCIDTGIYFTSSVPMPLLGMYGTGLTFVTGRAQVRTHMAAVLDEITSGRFDPSLVTTMVAPMDEAADAFATSHTKLVLTA